MYTGSMRNTAAPVLVTDEQRHTLKAWVKAKNTPQGIALRAKIILAAADGASNHGITRELGAQCSCGAAVSRRVAWTP